MGAECDKHGVDLHGDTHSGLVCPSCELERERDEARAEAEGYALTLHEVEAVLGDTHPECGPTRPADWVRRALRAREARAENALSELTRLREGLEHIAAGGFVHPQDPIKAARAALSPGSQVGDGSAVISGPGRDEDGESLVVDPKKPDA